MDIKERGRFGTRYVWKPTEEDVGVLGNGLGVYRRGLEYRKEVEDVMGEVWVLGGLSV